MSRPVAIVGVGQTPFRTHRPDRTLRELAQESARAALDMAGLTFDDVDGIVFSLAPEALAGIHAAERWCADAVGASGKPFLRVHTGGATGGSAAQAGYFQVASGMHDVVLVVGADKVAETPDAQRILNKIWDPVFEMDIALNAINMCAFQAVRHMARYGTTAEQLAKVAVRSRRNATRNPHAHIRTPVSVDEVLDSRLVCWPLKLFDCCPRSSGGCAVVLAAGDRAEDIAQRPAWIQGVGGCTNTYFMGDKMGAAADSDHADWDELARAAERAYRMAGVTRPAEEVSVAEIYAPFTSTEIAAVEALGFVPKGEGGPANDDGLFDVGNTPSVNPSGGTLCANPIAVTALVRIADAALQVMGMAGEAQLPNVERAVATGIGGSLQFHTCMVLGRDPAG